ncbi:unnamed protein product, partial [Vitis vinifera]|uniref:Uncharacterized protein n=1 Tax=Vitis vinifera TaxID=29760 RepID=E0CQV2_VITVI
MNLIHQKSSYSKQTHSSDSAYLGGQFISHYTPTHCWNKGPQDVSSKVARHLNLS